MQLCSFHDFVDCREGFEVLAEVYVPYFRGSAISIAQVGCAMVNADRDIVQQETAGFWHCHDVLAVPVSLYLSRFEFFIILNLSPFQSILLFAFAFSVSNSDALPGQLDVGSRFV
jgi:hypothetical protein